MKPAAVEVQSEGPTEGKKNHLASIRNDDPINGVAGPPTLTADQSRRQANRLCISSTSMKCFFPW